jgi:hypothetical protein
MPGLTDLHIHLIFLFLDHRKNRVFNNKLLIELRAGNLVLLTLASWLSILLSVMRKNNNSASVLLINNITFLYRKYFL